MPIPFQLQEWTPANDVSQKAIPWERDMQSGAYALDEKMIAVNRSLSEDTLDPLPEDTLQEMLQGVSYQSIVDDSGKPNISSRDLENLYRGHDFVLARGSMAFDAQSHVAFLGEKGCNPSAG